MEIIYHKRFIKKSNDLTNDEKAKLKERLKIFSQDEFSPVLNNHELKGKYHGFRSINITGDLRALYKKEVNAMRFITIDSHSNLYK